MWEVSKDRVTLKCSGLCGRLDWADRAHTPEADALWPEAAQLDLLANALDLGWSGESDGDIHICPVCSGDPEDSGPPAGVCVDQPEKD